MNSQIDKEVLQSNMQNICRICKKTTENQYAKQLFEEAQAKLIINIESITGEWLTYEEGWPFSICVHCELDLNTAVAFRDRFIQTQQQLHQEQISATAKSNHLDLLQTVQESKVQNDEKTSKFEYVDGTSTNTKLTLSDEQENVENFELLSETPDADEKLQKQLESSEAKTNNVRKVKSTEKLQKRASEQSTEASDRNKKPRIKWSLLTQAQARQILRERKLKDYICDQCGKHFTDLSNFKVHLVRHTGVKDFECNKCEKRFYTQRDLMTHDVIHSGIKPYTCRYCDKTFKRCSRRIEHERSSHTFERPYKCRFCEKTFINSNTRKDHETVHSSERNFYCELCDESFKRGATLKQHKQSKKHKSRVEGNNNVQN